MKKGQEIEFKIDCWNPKGKHYKKKVKAKVLKIIQDPLKQHKSKCYVKVKNENFGIPFDEVINNQFKLEI